MAPTIQKWATGTPSCPADLCRLMHRHSGRQHCLNGGSESTRRVTQNKRTGVRHLGCCGKRARTAPSWQQGHIVVHSASTASAQFPFERRFRLLMRTRHGLYFRELSVLQRKAAKYSVPAAPRRPPKSQLFAAIAGSRVQNPSNMIYFAMKMDTSHVLSMVTDTLSMAFQPSHAGAH